MHSNGVNKTKSWKETPPKRKKTWLLDRINVKHLDLEEVRPNGRPCWLRLNPGSVSKRRGDVAGKTQRNWGRGKPLLTLNGDGLPEALVVTSCQQSQFHVPAQFKSI